MEVNKIGPVKNSKRPKMAQNVSFGGIQQSGVNAAKNVAEILQKRMPKSVKFMKAIGSSVNGELGTIIITAIGTGLVAPIFIAFNPLSKADEKTKKYTAMRQPVSAVLAIIIQAGITKPLNLLVDHLSRIGQLGKSMNTSNLKGEAFYKNEYKKSGLKEITPEEYAALRVKKEISAAERQLRESGTIIFSNGEKLDDNEVIKLINKTLDTYKTELEGQKSEITPDKISVKVKRAQLLTNPQNSERIKLMCQSLQNAKTDDEARQVIDIHIKDKNPAIRELAEEFKGREIDAIQHRAKKTISMIDRFNNKIDGCKHIISNADDILGRLKQLKENPSNNSLMASLKAQVKDNPNSKGIIDYLCKNIAEVKDDEVRKTIIDNTIKAIEDLKLKENRDSWGKIIEIYQKLWYKNSQSAIDGRIKIIDSLMAGKSVANAKSVIADVENGIKVLGKENFVGDMVATWKTICQSRLKGFKQISGMLIGIFVTLPITCTALNWIYPRFMSIFFPHLTKNNKCSAPEEKVKAKGDNKE